MSWNQSVVTNAGVGLLNESLAGHTLTIESAVGGAGTLTEEELAAATDVADQKQTFALLGIEDIEGGKRVGIQITNNGVSESYILHQIGVQGRLEYEEAPLTLLIILQDEHGVEIPTEAENPDWLFEIYAVISISNKANITVNIDTSAIASITYVNHLMLQKADIDLSNLPSPQTALVNLGAGVRPNLLDNAYFVGGGTGWGVFPINQRGKTSYGANYGFDRWGMNGGTVTLGPTGVTWTSEQVLSQRMYGLNLADGKTRTVSYVDENQHGFSGILTNTYTQIGDYLFTYETGISFYMRSPKSSPAMAWVKLEEGENQTLFVENGDGTVTILPQGLDYGQELMKCQQYLQLYSSADARPAKAVDCRPVMRIDPTQTTIQIGETTYYVNSAE